MNNDGSCGIINNYNQISEKFQDNPKIFLQSFQDFRRNLNSEFLDLKIQKLALNGKNGDGFYMGAVTTSNGNIEDGFVIDKKNDKIQEDLENQKELLGKRRMPNFDIEETPEDILVDNNEILPGVIIKNDFFRTGTANGFLQQNLEKSQEPNPFLPISMSTIPGIKISNGLSTNGESNLFGGSLLGSDKRQIFQNFSFSENLSSGLFGS